VNGNLFKEGAISLVMEIDLSCYIGLLSACRGGLEMR